MINYKKIRQYCLGKELVAIDDILLAQNIHPDSGTRKEAAEYLTNNGWLKDGRRSIEGEIKSVWKKNSRRTTLQLEIIRLELLEKRQIADVDTLTELLAKGFTRDQALSYLRMLYNTDMETLNVVMEEEREAQNFGETMEEEVNTTKAASKMIFSSAYMFYIEKYFPGLMTNAYYKQRSRKLYAQLQIVNGDSLSKIEWRALSYFPRFLDLTTKIKDGGDSGEYKKYLVDTFITPGTIDKIFPNGVDYKRLASLCVICRNAAKEDSQSKLRKPFGLSESDAKLFQNHATQLRLEHDD